MVGGVAAAPLGAMLAKRLRPRLLLGFVAVVLIATSVYSIAPAWPIFGAQRSYSEAPPSFWSDELPRSARPW